MKKRRRHISLEAPLDEALEDYKKANGTSVSELIRRAVEHYIYVVLCIKKKSKK